MANVSVARTERERGKATHTLEYGGEVFSLPDRLPLEAWEAIEDEKVISFFRALLGDEWPRFRKRFDVDDLGPLADQLGSLYGMTPGESRASSTS